MNRTLASSRYARALFALAAKEKNLPEIHASLSDITQTTEEHPEVTAIIRNPTLKESEKAGFIEKIIPADCPALLKDFLRLLIEKKRFPLLSEIYSGFHQMFEKEQGILEVEVLSVIPFPKSIQEKLKKVLENKLRSAPGSIESKVRREVRLISKTEASLLGGFLLRFDGREIDCSFKSRIREIEQQLITQ